MMRTWKGEDPYGAMAAAKLASVVYIEMRKGRELARMEARRVAWEAERNRLGQRREAYLKVTRAEARAERKERMNGPPVPGAEGRRQTITILVDDPLEKGAKLAVTKNIRASGVDHMHARGRITDNQKFAADWFRALWERSEIGAAGAIDYRRPMVDGGMIAQTIPMASAEAALELARIAKIVNRRRYTILVEVAGRGRSCRDVAVAIDGSPHCSSRTVVMVSKWLCEALDRVIEARGLVSKGAETKRDPARPNSWRDAHRSLSTSAAA